MCDYGKVEFVEQIGMSQIMVLVELIFENSIPMLMQFKVSITLAMEYRLEILVMSS